MNRCLGDLLRCLVGDHVTNWGQLFPIAKFAYNSSINISIGCSPFEVVIGLQPRKPINLINLPQSARSSDEAESFASHIREIYDDVRRKIALSNEEYKAHANVRRHYANFEERDMVMVHIRPERFPKGTYKKLYSNNAGPYKIVKKISSNAYVLELPSNMGISNVFNVEDLTMYLGHSNHEDEDQAIVHLPPALTQRKTLMMFLMIKFCRQEEVGVRSIWSNGRIVLF